MHRPRRPITLTAALTVLTASAAFAVAPNAPASATPPITPPADDVETLDEAARAAYTFSYPLVTMELTRRQATNVPVPVPGTPAAPTNQLGAMTEVPEPGFESIVRPNVDTLYTSMFYDVSQEPVVVSVPDTDGRYHLAQVMDAWSNVEASPGSRTLGADVGAYEFALVGPGWEGELPGGVLEVPVDTSTGWMLSRIAVDAEDPADVAEVADLQDRMTATPLSEHGTDYRPPVNPVIHPDWPGKDVQIRDHVDGLSAEEYWEVYYDARSHRQVAPEDRALLRELSEHGWSPYRELDLDEMSAEERSTWERAKPEAIASFAGDLGGEPVDGWATVRDGVGDYGTDYHGRAATAYGAFAANLPEDAVCSISYADEQGQAYRAGQSYVLHLEADEVPDVAGFWSITLYDERGYLVDNPIDRAAVRGDRLATNPDGSVDVHLQPESPGADLESNWLPTPADGGFNLTMRAYWPGPDVLDGTWEMPGVTPVG